VILTRSEKSLVLQNFTFPTSTARLPAFFKPQVLKADRKLKKLNPGGSDQAAEASNKGTEKKEQAGNNRKEAGNSQEEQKGTTENAGAQAASQEHGQNVGAVAKDSNLICSNKLSTTRYLFTKILLKAVLQS
jgi:hypothetical protein